MKNLEYSSAYILHNVHRSPDRNLPASCQYCTYSRLPSSTGTYCAGYCKNRQNTNKKLAIKELYGQPRRNGSIKVGEMKTIIRESVRKASIH